MHLIAGFLFYIIGEDDVGLVSTSQDLVALRLGTKSCICVRRVSTTFGKTAAI